MSDKAIVTEDAQFIAHIPPHNFRVMKYVDSADNELVDLFIAVRASVIGNFFSEIKRNIGVSQFRMIFVHEDIPKEWLLEQLSEAGLLVGKVLDKLLVFSDWTVPDRVIKAWADDSQHVLIATALVSNDNLVVRNCALEELKVPFTSTVLCKIPKEERSKFEIDCVGSFISWPDLDIDLDFEALRYLVDPEWKKRCDAEQMLNEKGFGMAVKAVREINDITQAELAELTGISERQLRRYETEGMKPRISSLSKLATAHKMSLGQYLDRLAEVVSGPLALVVHCESLNSRERLCNLLENELQLSPSEKCASVALFRCSGRKEHEIWFGEESIAGESKNGTVAFALPVNSVGAFDKLRAFCSDQELKFDTAIGVGCWPSACYIPVDLKYFGEKLEGLAKRS